MLNLGIRQRRLVAAVAGCLVVVSLVGGWLAQSTPDRRAVAGDRGAANGAGIASVPGDVEPTGEEPIGGGIYTPSPGTSVSPGGGAGPWWHPTPELTWQWQLSGRVDLTVDAQVYDIDGTDSRAADVAALHKAGRKAICYVNAGAFEPWRPDAGAFPAAVLGKAVSGWPTERWLDIRRRDVLEPILAARFAACRSKGFDGVEPDNVDGYANATGFPLTAADQLTYNRMLADLAHHNGLAVGLKNDLDQAADLQPAFDFAVNEECVVYQECEALRAFIAAGKPVFHAEYAVSPDRFCAQTKALGFSSIRKHQDLGAWRQRC
jgi:hypothetical protein